MATPNMNLTLPVPTVTLGPDWATELNTALETVDLHDHTSGKGIPIRTAALDIDADLSFGGFRPTDVAAAQFLSAASPVSGLLNINSISASSGNLYWTNSAGVAVQITTGGSIVSIPGSLQTIDYTVTGIDLTILPADPFVMLAVDSSGAPRTITLPSASAVSAGRCYIIKDIANQSEVNSITILPGVGSTIDGLSSKVLTSNGGSIFVVSNGLNRFAVI